MQDFFHQQYYQRKPFSNSSSNLTSSASGSTLDEFKAKRIWPSCGLRDFAGLSHPFDAGQNGVFLQKCRWFNIRHIHIQVYIYIQIHVHLYYLYYSISDFCISIVGCWFSGEYHGCLNVFLGWFGKSHQPMHLLQEQLWHSLSSPQKNANKHLPQTPFSPVKRPKRTSENLRSLWRKALKRRFNKVSNSITDFFTRTKSPISAGIHSEKPVMCGSTSAAGFTCKCKTSKLLF